MSYTQNADEILKKKQTKIYKIVEQLICTPSQMGDNLTSRQTHCLAGLTEMNENSMRDPERFFCTICGKNYLRKRHLQRHMRDECIGIPPRFECEFCPSKFRRKYHLVRHLNSRHVDSITAEHSGIIVNQRSRPKSKDTNAPRHNENGQNDGLMPINLDAIKKENISSNTRTDSDIAAKDFSVDAIMMKREECDTRSLEMKLFEELQKKFNIQMNSDLLLTTLKQMNPIKF